jgi:hypothetical protein
MKTKIINQEIKTGIYQLQISEVNLSHEYYKEEEGNAPIKMQIKSNLTFQLGDKVLKKEISNTVFISTEEPVYKEILLHSKHVVLI